MKKILLIIMCTIASIACSGQWYGGYRGYGYGNRGYGSYGYQRKLTPQQRQMQMLWQQQQRQQQMLMRQQQMLLRQQAMILGQQVVFSGGYYRYQSSGLRVISTIPAPRVYIYNRSQIFGAMEEIVRRTILNGHIVLVQDVDPKTGAITLTQLTLEGRNAKAKADSIK